jgi:hypothetical protein
VAAQAELRRTVARRTLWLLPIAGMMTPSDGACMPIVVVGGVVACTFVWDLASVVSTALAWRRMRRGLEPRARDVDYGVGPDVWWRHVPPETPFRSAPRRELVARGSPRRAMELLVGNLVSRALGAAALAFLLVEVATAVGRRPCRDYTVIRTSARSVLFAALFHVNSHPGDCPTVAILKASRLLDDGFLPKDPWGNAYDVSCEDDEITVHTNGPDRKAGTEDDIVVPPPEDPK